MATVAVWTSGLGLGGSVALELSAGAGRLGREVCEEATELLPARSGSMRARPRPSETMVSRVPSTGMEVTRAEDLSAIPPLLMDGDEEEVSVVEDEAGELSPGKLGGPGWEAEWGLAMLSECRGERDTIEEGLGVAVKQSTGLVEFAIGFDAHNGFGIVVGRGEFVGKYLRGEVGAVPALSAQAAEFGLEAGIDEVNGELSGGDVGGDEDQGDEEDGGGETDEKVGQDELVAEAPEHTLAREPPEKWNTHGDERNSDEYLDDAKEGSETTGNPTAKDVEDAEPKAEPEDGSGEACRQPREDS